MYVCFSNVNFINTMIIMKKIIYLVLLALITGLVAQAHEKTGEWNGCDRYDFTFKDRQATIVVPKKAAKGNPWIWRPAFFDAFPSVDKALLEKGSGPYFYLPKTQSWQEAAWCLLRCNSSIWKSKGSFSGHRIL